MFSQLTCCSAFIFTILTLALILLSRRFFLLLYFSYAYNLFTINSNLLVLNFPKFKMMKIGDQKNFSVQKHILFFNYHFQVLIQTLIFNIFFLQIQILAILFIFLLKICQIRKQCHFVRGALYTIFSWHYNFYGNITLTHLIQILLFNNA